MASIIQNEQKCFKTGSVDNLHKHHIFSGSAKRELSEKYGLWIWLRADWHNMSDYGIHFDSNLDLKIKKMAQKCFEKTFPDLNFVEIFGEDYTAKQSKALYFGDDEWFD